MLVFPEVFTESLSFEVLTTFCLIAWVYTLSWLDKYLPLIRTLYSLYYRFLLRFRQFTNRYHTLIPIHCRLRCIAHLPHIQNHFDTVSSLILLQLFPLTTAPFALLLHRKNRSFLFFWIIIIIRCCSGLLSREASIARYLNSGHIWRFDKWNFCRIWFNFCNDLKLDRCCLLLELRRPFLSGWSRGGRFEQGLRFLLLRY